MISAQTPCDTHVSAHDSTATTAIDGQCLTPQRHLVDTHKTAAHIPRQKNSDSAMNMKLLETLSKVRASSLLASPTMLLYARQAMAGAATHIHMAGLCQSSALAAVMTRWKVMVKRSSHMIRAKPNLQGSQDALRV